MNSNHKTVQDLCDGGSFECLSGGELLRQQPVSSVYCCDLLSIVMGKAPADCAWVTIMGNINAIAVAVLVNAACVIIADGAPIEERALEKAASEGVILLKSSLPIYETAKLVDSLL